MGIYKIYQKYVNHLSARNFLSEYEINIIFGELEILIKETNFHNKIFEEIVDIAVELLLRNFIPTIPNEIEKRIDVILELKLSK